MNTHDFLTQNGYKKYEAPSISISTSADYLYQKAIRAEDGSKRFINIYEYDLAAAYPEVKSLRPGKTYEVEHAFQTPGCETWFQGRFYSFNEDQLQTYLANVEARLEAVFQACGGVGQD